MPVLPGPLLDVIRKAAVDVLAPPGVALAAAVPPGTMPRPGQRVELLDAGRTALKRGEVPGTLGRVLWALGKRPLAESTLRSRFPAAVPALDRLERLGFIRRSAVTEAPRVRVRKEAVYRLAPDLSRELWDARLKRAPRRRAILEKLAGGPLALPSDAALRALVEAGAVVREEREVMRTPDRKPLKHEAGVPTPTPHQREALSHITRALVERRDTTFLLYGITGSGKTEVYLRAAAHALEAGLGVIILVPEISLTHQVVDRFRSRFGDAVAVLHSGLSAGERFDQWRRIRDGDTPIAIGARSAVFAPLEDLGLIVIDEEHDGAYKNEEGFRYHARDVCGEAAPEGVATARSLLGSATPGPRDGDTPRDEGAVKFA